MSYQLLFVFAEYFIYILRRGVPVEVEFFTLWPRAGNNFFHMTNLAQSILAEYKTIIFLIDFSVFSLF